LLGSGLDRRVALLHAAHVLRAAVVGLQSREAKLLRDDCLCERHDRLARLDAAAAHADLELDIHVEVALQFAQGRGVVDCTRDLGATRKGCEALELLRADHFVRHETSVMPPSTIASASDTF